MPEQQWVGNLITAVSTFSVAGITILGYYLNNKLNSKSEKEKFERQKEWEREKINIEYSNKQNDLKFKVYNTILKLDGEVSILTYHPRRPEFDHNQFEKIIRPVLFDNYHLLDQDVRETINAIDYTLKKGAFFEELEEEEQELLANNYSKLIDRIDSHYKKN